MRLWRSYQPAHLVPVSGESIERVIDETARRLMRHDPSPEAFTRVLEAVSESARPERDRSAQHTWLIGASSLVAASLFAGVLLQAIGVAKLQVDAEAAGRGGLFLIWLSSTKLAKWINESESILGYPGILFCHTFGLATVVGISTAVNLRVLGVASRMSLAALRPLFRYMWIGFWVNAISGTLLFIADAPRRAANPLFELKLALVAVGVLLMALIERRLWQDDAQVSDSASESRLRLLAVASLIAWVAAIVTGRLIAYVF